MAAILVAVVVYARVLGTEELTGGARLMARRRPGRSRRPRRPLASGSRRVFDRWLLPVYAVLARSST